MALTRKQDSDNAGKFVKKTSKAAVIQADVVNNDTHEVVGRLTAGAIHGTITASDEAQAIVDRIDEIQSAVLTHFDISNIVSFAESFNEAEAKEKLATFLQSDLVTQTIESFESSYGITRLHHRPNTDEDLPNNSIYMLIEKDEQQRPTSILLGFRSDFLSKRCSIDVNDLARQVNIIKENGYSFLSNTQAFLEEMERLDDQLTSANNNDARIQIVNTFNDKYAGKLTLTYTADETTHKGSYTINDNHGLISFNGEHTLRRGPSLRANTQPSQLSSTSSSHASFWSRPQVKAAAAVVAIGTGLALTAYRLMR